MKDIIRIIEHKDEFNYLYNNTGFISAYENMIQLDLDYFLDIFEDYRIEKHTDENDRLVAIFNRTKFISLKKRDDLISQK